MFRFKGFIFNEYFTGFDKRTDPNKDAEDKGTNERYQEIFEDEMDEYMLPQIEDLQKNIYHPQEALERFVGPMEKLFGYTKTLSEINGIENTFPVSGVYPWIVPNDITFRRNVLSIISKLYSIKGTIRAYEILFSWLGFTVTIEELDPIGGSFDIPGMTFDMMNRTFDMDCPGCSEYNLFLFGPDVPLTAEQFNAILNIIIFNQPINASLKAVYYNFIPIFEGGFDYIFNFDLD